VRRPLFCPALPCQPHTPPAQLSTACVGLAVW
jgi:hypothetical protein